MIKIQKGGTFERPIIKYDEQTSAILRPVDKDGNPQIETVPVGHDNILLSDHNGNIYLIPESMGYAKEDKGLILYHGNQILRKYRYPFECNIAHESLSDLIVKINSLFKNNYPPKDKPIPITQ